MTYDTEKFWKLKEQRDKLLERGCNGNCTESEFEEVMISAGVVSHLDDCKYRRERRLNELNQTREGEVLINLKETEAVKHIKEYMGNGFKKGNALVLSGNTGTGKTIALYHLYVEVGGHKVHASNLQDQFFSENEFSRSLYGHRILLIDDLGVEYRKDWFNSKFDDLINYRYRKMLPTVITTNLHAEAFKDAYSARIISRIKEWGKFVQLGGKDMRGQLKS
tara:strand:- start:367 stop:1029 length:663 start_codon:yes stop_codon:yes gene_type:complete